jgi:flagellar L-ring protein precursor FlgH
MKVLSILVLMITVLQVTPVKSETIFNEASYESLTSDKHAAAVGDIITIIIYEAASASANADNESDKKIGLGLSTKVDSRGHKYSIGVDNDYSSSGEINRGGRLIANVSVTIKEVLVNGDLRIEGTQQLEFNDEKQLIKIRGRIRPEDISADNTVLSTRVADAEIEYVGDGVLGSNSGPGIFTRIFNFLF